MLCTKNSKVYLHFAGKTLKMPYFLLKKIIFGVGKSINTLVVMPRGHFNLLHTVTLEIKTRMFSDFLGMDRQNTYFFLCSLVLHIHLYICREREII